MSGSEGTECPRTDLGQQLQSLADAWADLLAPARAFIGRLTARLSDWLAR